MTTRKLILIVAAAIALTGCSASGEKPGAQPPAGDPAAVGEEQFSKCMKDNGGEIIDSSDDSGGGPMTLGAPAPTDTAKQEAAWETCRRFLPDGGNVKPMNTEQLEAARRFAKCMRDKGTAYPDPDPSSGGGDGAVRVPDGIDIQNPAVRRNLDECTAETGQFGAAPGPTK